jgi:hypothetical protein
MHGRKKDRRRRKHPKERKEKEQQGWKIKNGGREETKTNH